MNEILLARMETKANLIDELASLNKSYNNDLTKPATIPLSAMLTINAP